jgi:hypothetical protein
MNKFLSVSVTYVSYCTGVVTTVVNMHIKINKKRAGEIFILISLDEINHVIK